MRQGEVAPKGTWTGAALGGVKAPIPLILPDPEKRFARTAARLEALSAGHPMRDWLRFMAGLSDAQRAAAAALGSLAGPSQMAVEEAVAARMPPLAALEHRRDPLWRNGLAALLTAVDAETAPAPARATISALRSRARGSVESLADGFLAGTLEPADLGAALFVAAALQVYFTVLAAHLQAATLRLLPQRGFCPACGSTPGAGVVTASGHTPGARYLHCSLCSTAWNHVRAACITCGEARALGRREIEGSASAVKAEVCDACRTYAKMLYQAEDTQVDPIADDLATLGLDLMVGEAGWSRHAPNPLLLCS
jgi:FdhE protein